MQRAKTCARRLALAVLCIALSRNPALAEEPPRTLAAQVEGWTIAPMANRTACLAKGPTDGRASLSLAAQGTSFVILVAAPDFPTASASVPATLQFDDRPPEPATAIGIDEGMEFVFDGREPTWRLLTAKTLTVTLAGQSHSFPLSHVVPALDALARCIGQPTIAERMPDPPGQPIPGAGAWRLWVTLPNIPRRVCNAFAEGDHINLLLAMTPNGDASILARHWDWADWGRASIPVQISIDGAPPVSLRADPIRQQILIWLKDKALLQRLRAAKTLDWTLPTGPAHINVTGLGAAQDAVWACVKRKPGG